MGRDARWPRQQYADAAVELAVIERSGFVESRHLGSAVLVDPDGVIQFTEVTSEGIGRNAAELVRKVKAAQYIRNHPGEVCPAKWEEGEDTLAPSLDLVGKI